MKEWKLEISNCGLAGLVLKSEICNLQFEIPGVL